jgi:hypothetical protein
MSKKASILNSLLAAEHCAKTMFSCLGFALIFSLFPPWSSAHAAWHDEGMASVDGWSRGGLNLRVHYVRLAGRKGDLAIAVNEKNLAESAQQQCVPNTLIPERTMAQGERFVEQFPEFATYFEVEIYYAGNRTLTVIRSTGYRHDQRTCGIVETQATSLKFSSTEGICDVNMKARTARRNCDMQRHINAPLPFVLTGAVRAASPIRPIVAREFASTRCIPYLLGVLAPFGDIEACISQPPSGSLGPNPVAPEGTHLAAPGVLIQAKGPIDMQAVEVRWNLLVSSSLFSLPPGFDVKSAPGGIR